MTNKELRIEFSNLLARIKQTDFLINHSELRTRYIYALRKINKILNDNSDIDLSFWISVEVRLKYYVDIYQKHKTIEEVGVKDLLNIILEALEKDETKGINSSNFYEAKVKELTKSIEKDSKATNDYLRIVNYIDHKSIELEELKRELEQANKKLEEEKRKNSAKRLTELKSYEEYSRLLNELNEAKHKLIEAQEKKKELEGLKKSLEEQKKLATRYKLELEKAKEKENAIENWKTKISDAFKGLKIPIDRLEKEHQRLKSLYNIYKWASSALVLILVAIEFIVCQKINNAILLPTWEQYWTTILPIPVVVGLLWGFITQMNRAQRQMVVLARQIYEVEYIEGLLQALNTLSVDIGESMSKINEAISHLIDNHLRNMDGIHIDETTLQKLEKQDALPYEKIPELIKLIKDK